MDTLGSLIDKLCIVQLKLAHVAEVEDVKLRGELALIMGSQVAHCLSEIHGLITGAVCGTMPPEALCSPACKVYPGEQPPAPAGSLAHLIDYLASTNAALWATQEKIARIRTIPAEEKDEVVERCFELNMERSRTVEAIDKAFVEIVNGASRTA